MTEAQSNLLLKAKHGIPITPADVVATITSLEELRAYAEGLKRRGALTADAMAAIQDAAYRFSMRARA